MTLVQKVLQRFNEFTENYMKGANKEEKDAYLIKKNHTMRVFGIVCKIIPNSETMDEETKTIIRLAAILHDVGRFEQWRKTKSYSDVGEFKHATFGAKLLKEGMIKQFIPETRQYDKLIILAVERHGDLELPENLSEQQVEICKIVRDADRIDIFYQCIMEKDFPYMYKYEWGKPVLSDEVKKCFQEVRPMKYDIVHNKLDMLALRLGLMMLLSAESKEYVLQEKLADRMIDFFIQKCPYYDRNEIEWLRETTKKYLSA